MSNKLAALNHLGVQVQIQAHLSLYGIGWGSERSRAAQTERLRREAYGLDWVTGFYVSKGVRHHVEFDKSATDDYYLIYTEKYVNEYIIPRAPTQNYFGEPVQFNQLTREWLNLGRGCKEAFGRGEHNPMWLDPNSPWYHPAAARRFYWGKFMVLRQGPQWLDTPLATFEPPPWFLPYLNSNPRNIQPYVYKS